MRFWIFNGLWKYAFAGGRFQMYCVGHSNRTRRHYFDCS